MKLLWKNHGTKLIGGLAAAGGIVAAIDPATLAALLTAIAGPSGPGLAVAVIGVATFLRGLSNSKAKKAEESK